MSDSTTEPPVTDDEILALIASASEDDRRVLRRVMEHRNFLRITLADARESLANLDAEIRDIQASLEPSSN